LIGPQRHRLRLAGACADLIARSDKASEQWRHERPLKVFESAPE
jgi:hypothetical protein